MLCVRVVFCLLMYACFVLVFCFGVVCSCGAFWLRVRDLFELCLSVLFWCCVFVSWFGVVV